MPELSDYQIEGVRFLVEKRRVLLCDDPGLGKTVQTVTAVNELGAYPCLVVCPSGARLVWPDEWRLWIPGAGRLKIFVVRQAAESIPEDADVLVVSYGLAVMRWGTIRKTAWQSVVLDEFHMLKNEDSKRTQAIMPVARQAPVCFMLSGTPILNRPSELWPAVSTIWQCSEKLKYRFLHKYCDPQRIIIGRKRNPQFPHRSKDEWLYKKRWDFSGASNLEQLNEKLAPIMLRRRIDDVGIQLPPLRRVRLSVDGVHVPMEELRESIRQALEDAGWNVTRAIREMRSALRTDIEGAMIEVYGKLGIAKVPAMIELVTCEASSDNPVIVFAHTTAAIDEIDSACDGFGLRSEQITGATPLDERKDIERRFQAGELDVAVLSIMAANAATTWTRASSMMFLQMPWSSEIARQCEGRMRRRGQDRPMIARYLVTDNKIDQSLWRMLERKAGIIAAAIDGEEARGAFHAEREAGRWDVIRDLMEREVECREALREV